MRIRINPNIEALYGKEQAIKYNEVNNLPFLRWCFVKWRRFLCWLFYKFADDTWDRQENRSRWVNLLEKIGITNNSSCRYCGRTTRLDFYVDDELWSKIMPPESSVACYDCFTEIAERYGNCPTYWRLLFPEEEK